MIQPLSPTTRPTAKFSGLGLLLALLVLGIVLTMVFLIAAQRPGAASYPVDIRVAKVSMTAQAVEAVALEHLKGMKAATGVSPEIVRMTAISQSDLPSLEPNAGAPVPGTPDASMTVWVVRLRGAFLENRVPPGAEPFTSPTGVLIIDDGTGEVVGSGVP